MAEPALYPPFERTRLAGPAMRWPHECKDYAQRVLHTRPESLIGYWPLDEVAGTVAHDLSGRRHNGAYVGVDLAKTGIGDGRTCPWFDGVNDSVSIHSTSLANAFNGAEGTLLIWVKINSLTVWTDGIEHDCVILRVDNNNRIYVFKLAGGLMRFEYRAGGVSSAVQYSTTRLDWIGYALTWSAAQNQVKVYRDGVQTGITQTGLGIWAGTLSAALTAIGSYTSIPSYVWLGWIAHCAIWNCALSAQEVARLGTVD